MSAPADDGGLDEVLREFLAESREILARLEESLLALDRAPGDAELLAGIFRGFHTIKGNSSFLGFARVQETAHAAEAFLAKCRDGRARPSPAAVSVLLEAVDAVRRLLAPIEAQGAEAAADIAPLVRRLSDLSAETPPAAVAEAPAEVAAPEPAPRSSADGTVRVDVELLDRLMNLVGELVLARNQLLQQVPASGETPASRAAQRVGLITSRLQEGIMKTRMQPVGSLLHRFARVLRDLAVTCGKRVRLEASGEGTELDRAILEAISEPLTHLLRNAVDHGIEAPEERLRRGKPAEGLVRMLAYQESGQVVLEIADDGAGVDLARVRDRARRLGCLEAGDEPAEAALLNLIFARGLSTSEAVTHVSGRGVGMDVVKTNIERVGGTIELRNSPGHGLTLRLRIPLTLAILPALIVSAGGERFALPQGCLVELIRPGEARPGRGIERIHDAPVYRHRDRLLPLVDLGGLLGIPREAEVSPTIVVLQGGDHGFGLLVDAVHDTEEIVVKALSRRLRDLDLYAGAAILGDAHIALILDVGGLARRANFALDAGAADLHPAPAPPGAAAPRRRLLLLDGGDGNRWAIELEGVERLESLEASAVERAGGHEVAQYRGGILPLLRISEVLPERRTRRRGPPAPDGAEAQLPVVVFRRGAGSVGLVAEGILDIAEEPVAVERGGTRPGVRCCTVIRDRVTEVLDVQRLLEMAASAGKVSP